MKNIKGKRRKIMGCGVYIMGLSLKMLPKKRNENFLKNPQDLLYTIYIYINIKWNF